MGLILSSLSDWHTPFYILYADFRFGKLGDDLFGILPNHVSICNDGFG